MVPLEEHSIDLATAPRHLLHPDKIEGFPVLWVKMRQVLMLYNTERC